MAVSVKNQWRLFVDRLCHRQGALEYESCPLCCRICSSCVAASVGRVQICTDSVQMCTVRLRTEGLNQAASLKSRILEDTQLVCCLHI